MPRALLVLVAVIALIEVVLSLADAGIVFDPSLRSRVFVAGAFWASLLRGDTPLYRGAAGHHVPEPRASCTARCCTW